MCCAVCVDERFKISSQAKEVSGCELFLSTLFYSFFLFPSSPGLFSRPRDRKVTAASVTRQKQTAKALFSMSRN